MESTKFMTASLLAAGLMAGSASAGLVAYYDFEDLDNAPGLSGPNATEAGTGSYTGVAGGIVGNAAEFTGTSGDLITTALGFGGGGANQLGNNFSVAAWYNLDTDASSAASRFFVFEGDTDYDISYGVRALDVDGVFNDTQTYTNSASGPDVFNNHTDAHTPGTWQHVLLTYSSDGTTTTVSTYIDGNLSDVILEDTSALSSAGINIGNARNSATTRAFDGQIDEFAAWDHVLSASEIAAVYQAGLAGNPVPEPGSLALLAMGGLLIARRRRG